MPRKSSGPTIEQNLSKALRQKNSALTAKTVHQFRTNVRRLESVVGLAESDLGKKQQASLKRFTRARRLAGKVRDADVQLELLKQAGNRSVGGERRELSDVLKDKRDRAAQKLKRSMASLRKRDELSRLQPVFAGLKAAGARPLAEAEGRLVTIAETPFDSSDEERLHEMRIELKQVRYIAELSRESAARDNFISSLKNVQDALGEWHDHEALRQTAEKNLSANSALLAELRALEQARFRQAVSRLKALLAEWQQGLPTKKPAARALGVPARAQSA